MNARKEPVPVAPKVFPEHVFAPNRHGPKDPLRQEPIECLLVVDGRRCPFPRANAVHKTSQELAEALPPTPPEDVSPRIIGEGEAS